MAILERFEQKRRGVTTAQRAGTHGFAAPDAALVVSLICFVGSAAFWVPTQWLLTGPTNIGEMLIAISLGMFMVVGLPAVVAIFVPWSRMARTLARLNLTTFGQAAGIGIGLFLLYYAYQLLFNFWSVRPVVAASGLGQTQTMVGIIATILVPVFLWAPGSPDELDDKMHADQKIRAWEKSVKQEEQLLEKAEREHTARMRALRELDVQAAQTVRNSLAELTDASSGELQQYLVGILTGVDTALLDLYQHYSTSTNVATRYQPLLASDDIVESLAGIAGLLEAPPARARAPETVARATVPQPDAHTNDRAGASANEPRSVHGPLRPAPANADDATVAARAALGSGAWKRADLESALSIQKSKASDLIRRWREEGIAISLTEPKDHYQFVVEVQR